MAIGGPIIWQIVEALLTRFKISPHQLLQWINPSTCNCNCSRQQVASQVIPTSSALTSSNTLTSKQRCLPDWLLLHELLLQALSPSSSNKLLQAALWQKVRLKQSCKILPRQLRAGLQALYLPVSGVFPANSVVASSSFVATVKHQLCRPLVGGARFGSKGAAFNPCQFWNRHHRVVWCVLVVYRIPTFILWKACNSQEKRNLGRKALSPQLPTLPEPWPRKLPVSVNMSLSSPSSLRQEKRVHADREEVAYTKAISHRALRRGGTHSRQITPF